MQAEQDVLTKAIKQLQYDYKFTVVDVTYGATIRAWAECAWFQKKCRILEAKVAEKEGQMVSTLCVQQAANNWSPGSTGTMTKPNSPPPPPHKKSKLSSTSSYQFNPTTSAHIDAATVDASLPHA